MDLQELHSKQAWTLEQKVFHSLEVIGTFTERQGGLDKVYISFSGGKDSTVLLDWCQKVYPCIMAVFINTGNEWPEIIQFINRIKNGGHTNLVILRPSLTPRDTWRQVGFPLVSKEVAQKVELIRKSPTCATAQKWLRPDNPFKLGKRWQYLLQEDYNTSSKCCDILKKRPAKQFEKETGRSPIIGIMAAESKMRESKYLQMGSCNYFAERGRSVSWPLAIWNDDDIWAHIEKRKLPHSRHISKRYHKNRLCRLWFWCVLQGRGQSPVAPSLHTAPQIL